MNTPIYEGSASNMSLESCSCVSSEGSAKPFHSFYSHNNLNILHRLKAGVGNVAIQWFELTQVCLGWSW